MAIAQRESVTMRVYEFAKELSIPNKELISLLQEKGFAVTSHMSLVPDEALTALRKKKTPAKKTITTATKEQKAKSPAAKKTGEANKKELVSEAPDQKVVVEKKTTVEQAKQPAKVPASGKPVSAGPVKSVAKSVRPSRQPVHHARQQTTTERVRSGKRHIPEKRIPEEIVLEPMTLGHVADKLGRSINELILLLLRQGIAATKNQVVPEEVVATLAEHFQIKAVKPEAHGAVGAGELEAGADAQLEPRAPVVVILGHVDHGKTTLLDFIRKTRVTAGESGGITQHLGAYEVNYPPKTDEKIAFLDTPGHQAFSRIRQRGTRVADIAVVIVAADDGVMPQTIEAIETVRAMDVPVIVAINKIDRVPPERLETIKRQLGQHGMLLEEWGGDVICAPISATEGTGVDHLLEMITLQSHMLELRADAADSGRGYILEAHLEKGMGPVATVLLRHGSVSIGDYFVSGSAVGSVTTLINSYGKRVRSAHPSEPVRVSGFSALPNPGDSFEVVSKESYKRARGLKPARAAGQLQAQLMAAPALTLVLKADTNSSREVLAESVAVLSKKTGIDVGIVSSGAGVISERDVELAYNTGARIIGFRVKADPNAQTLAKRREVTIDTYDIIYRLLEDLEAKLESMKPREVSRNKSGEAEVLKVFDIKGVGVIAGCKVTDGLISKDGWVTVMRGGKKVGEGKIKSLQREKKAAKEVHAGYECGFLVEGFKDFKVGDTVECYL